MLVWCWVDLMNGSLHRCLRLMHTSSCKALGGSLGILLHVRVL